jgi:hypothetical protein
MPLSKEAGLASRLGHGIGRGVRFFLCDTNLILRWVKRFVLIVASSFVVFQLLSWIAGVAFTVLLLGVLVLKVDAADVSHNPEFAPKPLKDEEGYQYGLMGYGYYVNGVRIDGDDEA